MDGYKMKGICMKDFLLKQFLAGTKTMTRRTGGMEAINEEPESWVYSPMFSAKGIDFMFKSQDSAVFLKPRYRKGEGVFIKESYLPGYFGDERTAYALYWPKDHHEQPKFKNKLFMPAKYARYFVRIEDVYPQRLQDITEEEAEKEGVEYATTGLFKDYLNKNACYNYATDSFASLIDSINGKGTWDKNPWVWVYKIKLVEKPENL